MSPAESEFPLPNGNPARFAPDDGGPDAKAGARTILHMRCLGIDYGEKRIGLCYGDDLGVATPLRH